MRRKIIILFLGYFLGHFSMLLGNTLLIARHEICNLNPQCLPTLNLVANSLAFNLASVVFLFAPQEQPPAPKAEEDLI
jgi:hypothetical protein